MEQVGLKPPLPSATPTWHNDTYPSISPSRPELSVAGKTVIITGAGSGIGRETALAFATAGAARLVLLGRNGANLEETKKRLLPGTACDVHPVSITDSKGLRAVAEAVGEWDVLILNAGTSNTPSSIADADIDEWWSAFETNTRGPLTTLHALLPTARPTAAILSLTSASACVPPFMAPGLSSYAASKLASAKILEFAAAEHEGMFVASLHPGFIETETFKKSGSRADLLPMDTVQLPAHFMVWLVSPQAAFLKGRTVWANWDVDELATLEAKVGEGLKMTAGVNGWPYAYIG